MSDRDPSGAPDALPTLDGALRILLPAMDIVEGRVEAMDRPAWCDRRGWTGALLALDDAELARCEAEGLAARAPFLPQIPADLAALAAGVRSATRLPSLSVDPHALPPPALQAVAARKRLQLATLLGAVAPMAERASRIVDVGAGSGHFTRLAAARFDREALGIERDPGRVAAALARASREPGDARFVAVDACREPLALSPGDLAVGLHACGELGDRLVLAAADAGADVALVSCCLQKITAPERAPLSRAAAGLSLRRDVLGLANLTAEAMGVEVSLAATMAAREARFALLLLLRERGVDVGPGEEMRGINRRRARAGLRDLAERALAQRGLPPATDAELTDIEDRARRRYAEIRRLSLPRSMLARLVEIAVVLDRAAALRERGHHAVVAALFDRAVTPRNVALFASRSLDRLPLPRA